MPFCKPPEGIKKASNTINPGTILLGIRIENSPYNFAMMVEETGKEVCKSSLYPDHAYPPLNIKEFRKLQKAIKQQYRVRLILDNLPVTMFALERDPDLVYPGYELGFSMGNKVYINNHLMFKILVHRTNGQYSRVNMAEAELEAAAAVEAGGRRRLRQYNDEYQPDMWMVVGFEVVACSIKRQPGQPIDPNLSCGVSPDDPDAPEPQEVKKDGQIVYTYDVYWQESPIEWHNRWDAYLKMPGGKVHWFSILNSVMVVVVMSCIVAMIMMRTIRRDLQKYEQLLVDSGSAGNAADMEESGWKMVSGDVFRAPASSLSLAVFFGSGVQIFMSSSVTLLFASLGFLSPASRGSLLTAMLVMYLLLSVSAGYSAVWLWGVTNRSFEGWFKVCWRVACFFPGVTASLLVGLNLFLWYTGSAGAIPLGFFFSMIFLWLIVSIPLAYSGGMLAARREITQFPTRTNQIPRHIPPPHWASHSLVLFLAAGLLPFGTIFVELYFAMASMWQGYFYYIFGFLLLVVLLTLIITIEVSIVCTYVQLCAEDYLWWWRSFYRGGSIAMYILLYSVGFLVNTLHHLSGFVPVVLYLSYMGLFVFCVFLAMGMLGFLSSYIFVYQIFMSVKAD
jgi:transmembrane 9 superfamily member 2/4